MSRGFRDGDSKRYFDWLYYAAIDLRAAKLLLDDARCYNIISFHCQQCVEKALKGYLLWRRHRLYDGHNLPFLCKQAMQEDPHFRDRIELCRYSADGVHSLGSGGEADPWKDGIDRDLIDQRYYSTETESPQTLARRNARHN